MAAQIRFIIGYAPTIAARIPIAVNGINLSDATVKGDRKEILTISSIESVASYGVNIVIYLFKNFSLVFVYGALRATDCFLGISGVTGKFFKVRKVLLDCQRYVTKGQKETVAEI